MQFIERETNGRVLLGAGTLYGAINNLRKKKWIAPVSSINDHNKKEYLITEAGRQAIEKELKRMNQIMDMALKITGGA